jgi:hypothetical protein
MESAKLKILFLASRPQDAGALHLDWDLQAFQRALDTTRTGDRFLPKFLWAPTPADLIDNLSLFKPDIVHFSGHGQQAGDEKESGIALVDRTQKKAVISEQGLLSLLRGLREDRPQLLVLASCWSLGIVRSATSFVKCGIGCPSNLNDVVASGFVHAFYASIAAGRSIRNAYEIGVSGISDSVAFDRRPMLEWAHDVDPAKLILLGQASPPKTNYGEIAQLLDLGLFSEAAFKAESELRLCPTNDRILYYLALAKFNGRAPRTLFSIDDARRIQSLLERGLKISAMEGPGPSSSSEWQGCVFLLWAWLKEDFFARNGFLSGPGPDLEFLLQRSAESQPSRTELVRLSRLFPSGEASRSRAFLDFLFAKSP